VYNILNERRYVMFKELEVVELTHDIKENKLIESSRGTVVEIYKGGEAYEVEFISPDDKTSVLLTLSPEDIRPSVERKVYFTRGLDASHNLSTVTASGTAVNLTKNNLLKGADTLDLEIRTEMSKDEAIGKAFYYQSVTI